MVVRKVTGKPINDKVEGFSSIDKSIEEKFQSAKGAQKKSLLQQIKNSFVMSK